MVSFKGAHVVQDSILTCVRWYLASPLSYRQGEELMEGAGGDRRPRHDPSLGPEVQPPPGSGVPSPQAPSRAQLADG
jgi:hypothetical protein